MSIRDMARLTLPCFNEAAADDRGKRGRPRPRFGSIQASMRPRPMTAENVQTLEQVARRGRLASMRPRPMTAENREIASVPLDADLASMRPRPMTAENIRRASTRTRRRLTLQ